MRPRRVARLVVAVAMLGVVACASTGSGSGTDSGACIGYSCSSGSDPNPYCDCTLGLGVSGGGACTGPEFGPSGNCCFHPDTASCRCDGEPGCSNNGVVVASCSAAIAELHVECANTSDGAGPYCGCALTNGAGGGVCTGSQFGASGNCCLHPDTLTCRCDGNPGCSNGGTVVQSCTAALAVSAQPQSVCR